MSNLDKQQLDEFTPRVVVWVGRRYDGTNVSTSAYFIENRQIIKRITLGKTLKTGCAEILRKS